MSQIKDSVENLNEKSTNSFKAAYTYTSAHPTLKFDPSAIKNRLPNIVFTGPKGLYDQRVKQFDYPREVGIGQSSGLRSLDIEYLTRGQSGILIKQRNNIPGEIGWSYNYFRNVYPRSVSSRRTNPFQHYPR